MEAEGNPAKKNYTVLIVSGLIVATAGPYAAFFSAGIEDLFVFAAGLSNLVAVFSLSKEALDEKNAIVIRLLLGLEMIFFCIILGIDVRLAFSAIFSDQYDYILFTLAFALIIFSLLYILCTKNPKDKAGFLISAFLFSTAVYLIPDFFRRYTHYAQDILMKIPVDEPQHVASIIEHRFYPWIHLFLIPAIYYLVDATINKTIPICHKIHTDKRHKFLMRLTLHNKRTNEWSKYLILDRSLFFAGIACVVSGLGCAALTQGVNSHFYEAGAAALILIVGNAWYISLKTTT